VTHDADDERAPPDRRVRIEGHVARAVVARGAVEAYADVRRQVAVRGVGRADRPERVRRGDHDVGRELRAHRFGREPHVGRQDPEGEPAAARVAARREARGRHEHQRESDGMS